jgi:chitinase
MVAMESKAKKILSFGGWSFSTDHDTSPIFATGVSDANRELFATKVVQFLKDNKLDGLDFDWEYPGATDIAGSVPGSPSDGLNYLKFLKSVKSKLPSDKSLSIALPASYWYLKGFPVKLMSAVVGKY